MGNVQPNYINPVLSPASAMKNVIFIIDNKAITVGTDGRITIVGTGKSTVHVIPTCNTALAKTLLIEVVAPAIKESEQQQPTAHPIRGVEIWIEVQTTKTITIWHRKVTSVSL